jgi:F0F1-type ATP synthase beta subunit
MIIDGECDDVPDQDLYLIGAIDEALEKTSQVA